MKLIDTILDIFFPVNCLHCGKGNKELCSSCIINFPEAERESANWIYPLFDYRYPPVKKAILLLKYKNKKRIANIFANIMYERILEEISDLRMLDNFKEIILIPIPLAKKRKIERGFNQAELLCKELIKIDKNRNFIYKKDILIKPKDTIHQANIENRDKRLKNLVGSFIVKDPTIIKNKNIILIDDVTTTGATLSEARKTLKKEGARSIIAFTVAH